MALASTSVPDSLPLPSNSSLHRYYRHSSAGLHLGCVGGPQLKKHLMIHPVWMGMDPSQIEKIMIQELLDKPKGSKNNKPSISKSCETNSGKAQKKTDAC